MRQKLLNPAPAIPLVRELAVRIGVNQAIVLQQLHFRARWEEDGWVERSIDRWSSADFPFWSSRTVRRVFDQLEAAGLIDRDRDQDRVRIRYGAVPEYEIAADDKLSQEEGHVGLARVGTARGEEQKTPPVSPSREHGEFGEWIGDHAEVTGHNVLKAGTKARANVAAMFSARREEGYSLDDLKLATRGAFADEYRREHGYFDAVSVLRPTKVAGLIEKGRRAQAPKMLRDPLTGMEFEAGTYS